MPILNVPNAQLYFETTGAGPLLLCIPGANGEHHIFQGLAAQLSGEFTVLTYDRRGFSQSPLTGKQDYAHRLQIDANDAAALIAEVGQGQSATIFSSSSGAIVGLQTLLSHPEAVKTLIAHEPPLVKMVPEGPQILASYAEVYQIYRDSGIVAAMQKFGEDFSQVDRQAMGQATNPDRGPSAQANSTYWFERELPAYPSTDFDLDTLAVYRDRLIMGGGTQSDSSMPYQVAARLAEHLGVPLAPLTGGHVGYAMFPQAFAQDLRRALQG